jgi:hypothetical protein
MINRLVSRNWPEIEKWLKKKVQTSFGNDPLPAFLRKGPVNAQGSRGKDPIMESTMNGNPF